MCSKGVIYAGTEESEMIRDYINKDITRIFQDLNLNARIIFLSKLDEKGESKRKLNILKQAIQNKSVYKRVS